jgi:REP element-mobilizing transposase RayT
MKTQPEKPVRQSIRLKDYDYSQEGGYFVTICTQNLKNLLGEILNGKTALSPIGSIAQSFWMEIPKHFANVKLDKFVIMPNHIQGIIIIKNVGAIHELPLQKSSSHNNRVERRKMLIPRIVGFYKMNTAKQINLFRKTSGSPVWYRNYYEHVIRNEEELNHIRQYIMNNPLRWELDRENPLSKNFNLEYKEYFAGIYGSK